MKNSVLILDFGSQYTKLIARRIRELNVYSEIVPFNIPIDKLKKLAPGAIILSGGPSSVYADGAPRPDKELLELGIPILGICYGLQLIGYYSQMKVIPAGGREYGLAHLEIQKESKLLKDVKNHSNVWMSHGDKITGFPEDFIITARTDNTELAAIESEQRRIYGVQFHPEVVHTDEGKKYWAILFLISPLSKPIGIWKTSSAEK